MEQIIKDQMLLIPTRMPTFKRLQEATSAPQDTLGSRRSDGRDESQKKRKEAAGKKRKRRGALLKGSDRLGVAKGSELQPKTKSTLS